MLMDDPRNPWACVATRNDGRQPVIAGYLIAVTSPECGRAARSPADPRPSTARPDDVPAHPLCTSIDVASLAPNAEITVFPWKEPDELKQRTIDRVRRFLRAHIPLRAAAQ
jgi:hypothetical protein